MNPGRRRSRLRGSGAASGALLTTMALALSGCSAVDGRQSGIVVTTNILGDITREIVGDHAEVTVLMKPNADPHSFGISAQQAAQIEDAELIVANGLGLEEGVLRNVEAAGDAGVPVLTVGDEIDPISYTEGETKGETDPHFWTDPVRVGRAVDVIAAEVIEEVDGAGADGIRANAREYGAEVDGLDTSMRERFAQIPAERRNLVTNHHVFGYLAQRYDFTVVGAVIPNGTTLASPSGSDLKSLSDAVRDADVRTVFADSSQPDRLAEVMAAEAGLDIRVVPLYSESLTRKNGGAATYIEMTHSNTEAIADGLAEGRSEAR